MRQPDADYLGPAVVVLGDREFAVRVRLRGHRQPIDGIYRWYGRVDPDAALDAAAGNRKQRVTLRTTEGAANAILGDRDFWGDCGSSGTARRRIGSRQQTTSRRG
ncbi:DUF4873 domain-containing protein [Nocardia nova]|uniref:DUF4873 domain-containing protein n=1 Tax=Nocardia nova TaxID=37330 RepID=UPI0025B12B1D|nr:DUF4873 domain-containing protein [Nocardia nova]